MKNLLILLLTFFVFSCNNKSAEEAAKLKGETFKIHDDIMPISMNLGDLKEQVMKKVELDSSNRNEALNISLELDNAYNDMEAWMPKLGDAADMKDDEEKVKTLTVLKAEGEKIKKSTLEAKKKADEFLK